MPIYSLRCPLCNRLDEYILDRNEGWHSVKCTNCLADINRRQHRDYKADAVVVKGDTCSDSCNMSDYYDEGMGEHVRSRTHRRELMKRKGLREYAPDPEMKKHRDEAKRITNSAPPGDKEALAAARRERKTAIDKRRDRNIAASLDEGFRKADV